MEANECCEPFIQAINSKGQDCLHLSRQLAELRKEVSVLRTRAESAERERDEYKECYRLAMTSVNDAYDKGYANGQRDRTEEVVGKLGNFAICQANENTRNAFYRVAETIMAIPIKERP